MDISTISVVALVAWSHKPDSKADLLEGEIRGDDSESGSRSLAIEYRKYGDGIEARSKVGIERERSRDTRR
jgi:hypothetical protein